MMIRRTTYGSQSEPVHDKASVHFAAAGGPQKSSACRHVLVAVSRRVIVPVGRSLRHDLLPIVVIGEAHIGRTQGR